MSVICLNSFRDDRLIVELTEASFKKTKKIKQLDWYEEIRQRTEARFGEGLPKHFVKAMAKDQPRPYMFGDVHNVSYRARTPNFNNPLPVPCKVTSKSCAKSGKTLVLGKRCEAGVDEAFPWMDMRYHVTLNFLRSLPDKTELVIYTRSDLVAHDDYLAELQRLDVMVYILYVTKDDDWNRTNEPGCPSFKRRLNALLKLQEILPEGSVSLKQQSLIDVQRKLLTGKGSV